MVSALNGKNGQNEISFITKKLVIFVDTWEESSVFKESYKVSEEFKHL